ncbi:MAG: hypothetical protein WBX01_04130, partial [Nitrososphaeraceae archaeon]
GLSTYTEVMSGFRYGDLNTGTQAGKPANKRYMKYISNYFDNPEYDKVDQRLYRDGARGLYGAVRSGLTHEYFMKKRSKVVIEDDPLSVRCGVFYDPKRDPQIIFYVRKYFEDFKHGFDKYYKELKNDGSGKLLGEFDRALKSVNSEAIGRPVSAFSGGVNFTIARSGSDLDNR